MKRRIRKVAVLGSGVMGSGIACHLANIGLEVIMLDIVPFNMPEDKVNDKATRNSIVNGALKKALKSKPAALYTKKFSSRISTGNFDDDLNKIADCDWIIEVIIEQLDIKRTLFSKVDKIRKKGSLVTSNTSGIPIHMMAEGLSEDFRQHFCGTHFFNPPRYLRLFEVIPTADTSQEVVDFFMHYGDVYLGKKTVLCKDTPAFIGNRIGVYSMAKIFHLANELELTIEEVDKLTGAAIGRPNTGTFRLGDLVGLDVAVKVLQGIEANCPDDEQKKELKIPASIKFLTDNKFLGNKSGQGFYQKTKEKDAKGKTIINALDLKTLEYRPSQRPNLASLKEIKQIESLDLKVKTLFNAKDKGGELVRKSLLGLFAYASNRIPEISEQLFSIDDAMKAGFAWQYGPFQYWDLLGVQNCLDLAIEAGEKVAPWIQEMLDGGNDTFYKVIDFQKHFYDKVSKSYMPIPGTNGIVHLDNYRSKEPVFKNAEMTLHDIGDGVLCLEFTSKMNTIGEGILRGLNTAIEIAEKDWNGLVIGNNAQNFSVGANLMLIAMLAYQQEYDELNMAVNLFQQTTMRCRYSAIPVVAATQGYTFGGGCETIMHCDAAVASAESYIGLVEVGVGLIPGGGGTKEFAVRISDAFTEEKGHIPILFKKFQTLAMGKVATSAEEAFEMSYLQRGRDRVSMNVERTISEAKKEVLRLAPNYTQPFLRNDIRVMGKTGMGALMVGTHSLKLGKYASEHDIKIANKIASVLCGGDLSGEQLVSEQYLLDLEREAFLSLCGEQKTMERIQHMLQTNKPLRN